MKDDPQMIVDEVAAGDFRLTVMADGQRFDCGSYLTRPAALQAGRLFAERKKGEARGRGKRPRGKSVKPASS